MRVTVIFDDSTVYVDGVARHVIMPPCDSNFRAIQWYDEHGDVEVRVGVGFSFRDFGMIDVFIKAWERSVQVLEKTDQTLTAKSDNPSTGVDEM